MTEEEFKQRTKRFALDTIAFVDRLPNSAKNAHIGRQLLRSGTSVGANYRAACRAKSRADMIAKLAIVEEEADESMFWLELLEETSGSALSGLTALLSEADEIVRMTVSSIRALRIKNQ